MKTLTPACGIGVAALLLVSGTAQAQPPMLPVGARMTFEVAHPGGPWSSSLAAMPGDRIEWRVKVSYTGSNPNVDALGSVYYQPIISNVDNTGAASSADQLGVWRNGGVSGIGNTTLRPGLLTTNEGNSSASLASYGRVQYGFTSRSNTPGFSGGLIDHHHSGGSNDAPLGDYIRIAGNRALQWYAPELPTALGPDLYNRVLWGVVSDNPTRNSTGSSFFLTGSQDIVIFRHSLILSADNFNPRVIDINAEAATMRRTGGTTGDDDTRFMSWMLSNDAGPGSTGTERVGVEYVRAEIVVVPAPTGIALIFTGASAALRRRRGSLR